MMLRWTRPLPRLILDAGMLAYLLLGFAYWWLGNAAHEVLGTVFLLIVLRHVANNLFWWRGLRRGRMTVQRGLNAVLGGLLALAILALLLSSLAVSRTLAAWLPIQRIFLLQEVHWFAAYWVIALAALHLGVNWSRIAALLRNLTGRGLSRAGRVLLWGLALAVAGQGVISGTLLGFWPRLRFSYSLSMWDFNASVWPFFLHWGAALMTLAVAAHGVGVVGSFMISAHKDYRLARSNS